MAEPLLMGVQSSDLVAKTLDKMEFESSYKPTISRRSEIDRFYSLEFLDGRMPDGHRTDTGRTDGRDLENAFFQNPFHNSNPHKKRRVTKNSHAFFLHCRKGSHFLLR